MKKIILSMMFIGAILALSDSAMAQNCPDPQAEPEPNQVMIYTEENYQGDCNIYTGYRNNFPRYKSPIRSIKVGSEIEIYINDKANFRGFSQGYRKNTPSLNHPGGENKKDWVAINFVERPPTPKTEDNIYTTTPKNAVSSITPNDDQVQVCSNPGHGGGCRKVGQGDYDFNSLGYQSILIGRNVKVQVYSERNYYGNSTTLSFTGKPQRVSKFYSMRVLSINENRIADKFRPTPTPIPTLVPTPVSTPNSTVDNSPVGQANREKVYILNGSGTKCLTIKDGNADNFTPVILAECTNSDNQQWTFTSDGKIRGLANMCITNDNGLTLRTCQPDGAQNWLVSDKNEIKRAWACLSEAKLRNGSPGVTNCNGSSEQRWRFESNVAVATTSPTVSGTASTVNTSTPKNPIDGPIRVVGKTELGLTVQNQNLSDNTPIILHSGFNNWTMLSNGAIVLKSNPRLGLTVKNQRIANGSEIILHSGYNLWQVLSNGAIVLKDNPAFGITVLNQNLNDNAAIILHSGYNTWTKDYTSSNNVATRRTNPPPKANHYPPPNSGGSPYVLCGYENQYCSFQGIGTVAYGVNGIFKYKQNVSMGIQCNDANFGFVVEGVEKRCYFKFEREIKRNTTPTETDKPSPPNENFRVCGTEGTICHFSGKGRVAYGYNNKNGRKFLFKQNVNGRITCNNQTFGGDPAPGKAKVCYVQVLN